MHGGPARFAGMCSALCLALAGCSSSTIDPDATVRISGRALDADGRPLAGARVLLFKEADLGEVVLGTTLAIGTLSTVCLLPDPPAVCHDAKVATADDQGRYRLEVKGSDTQGTLGSEATLDLVVSGGEGGSSTTLGFTAKDTEITLPDARLWRTGLEVSGAGPGVGLAWRALPPAAGRDPEYSGQLYDADTGDVLWTQVASGSTVVLDTRYLEDRPGTVAVGATADLPGGTGAGDVRAAYLTERRPVEVTTGAPASRGVACAPVVGRAARTGRPAPACPVTDGDLATPARLAAAGDRVVTGAVLDLGSVRPVDLVVARGFAGQLLVELSTDGTTFRPAGTRLGTAVAVRPEGRPRARFVRVRSAAGLDQSLATEVSVW